MKGQLYGTGLALQLPRCSEWTLDISLLNGLFDLISTSAPPASGGVSMDNSTSGMALHAKTTTLDIRRLCRLHEESEMEVPPKRTPTAKSGELS
jgi:hypothetical protein